jgi:hypothetical protein
LEEVQEQQQQELILILLPLVLMLNSMETINVFLVLKLQEQH